MKKKILTRLFFLIILIVISIVVRFLVNEYIAHKLPYGRKANNERVKLEIPVIKKNMYTGHVNRRTLGNRWINIRQNPKKDEILHVWKMVIPNEQEELHEEKDGFRKLDKDGKVNQFNLRTTIQNDKIIEQKGWFVVKDSSTERIEFVGDDLDEIIKEWKID